MHPWRQNRETVETVEVPRGRGPTSLKQGVNENFQRPRSGVNEDFQKGNLFWHFDTTGFADACTDAPGQIVAEFGAGFFRFGFKLLHDCRMFV
jgi:hypothetical protein